MYKWSHKVNETQRRQIKNENKTITHANGASDAPASCLVSGHSASFSWVTKGTEHVSLEEEAMHLFISGQYLQSSSLSRHSSH
mmetsp:Transcript_12957/g.16214  ORF Transcript_12957/g.16214 Transcript_12957/m.16214 type:complete len:83 (+) Transcript_12957:1226-1474(+)